MSVKSIGSPALRGRHSLHPETMKLPSRFGPNKDERDVLGSFVACRLAQSNAESDFILHILVSSRRERLYNVIL
jgi:hypothetical protein